VTLISQFVKHAVAPSKLPLMCIHTSHSRYVGPQYRRTCGDQADIWQEHLLGVWKSPRSHLLNHCPESAKRHVIFCFTGHGTGPATYASPQVHHHRPARYFRFCRLKIRSGCRQYCRAYDRCSDPTKEFTPTDFWSLIIFSPVHFL